MAYDIQAPTTGDALSSMDAEGVRKLWQKGVDTHETSEDFFSPLEGSRGDSVVVVKNDTSKGNGHTITFTNMSDFYASPHHGDDYFEDQTHFEDIRIDSYPMTVDFLRHGYAITERAEEVMGMRGEIKSGANKALGSYVGRIMKSERLAMEFLHRGDTDNNVYAGSSLDVDSITTADTLTYDELMAAGQMLPGLGGAPAKVGTTGEGQKIWRYCVASSQYGLLGLKQDSKYVASLQNADTRGNNYLWKGGYADIDGHFIKEWKAIDHDGHGPLGNPLTSRAHLGVAIAAGTTAFDIKGGGNATIAADTKAEPFRYFPKYAYKFIDGDSLTPDAPGTNDFYVAVINPKNAGTAPGKFGFYKITTNDGNNLTVSERLGSAASGIRATQVGNVTWDAAVNTDAHEPGSLIVRCNANGVPIGSTLVLGSKAAFRGYGKYRNHRATQLQEGGFIEQRFIWSVLGQTVRKDRLERPRGFLKITHADSLPNVSLTPTLA